MRTEITGLDGYTGGIANSPKFNSSITDVALPDKLAACHLGTHDQQIACTDHDPVA